MFISFLEAAIGPELRTKHAARPSGSARDYLRSSV
jgi:hypothetical protein